MDEVVKEMMASDNEKSNKKVLRMMKFVNLLFSTTFNQTTAYPENVKYSIFLNYLINICDVLSIITKMYIEDPKCIETNTVISIVTPEQAIQLLQIIGNIKSVLDNLIRFINNVPRTTSSTISIYPFFSSSTSPLASSSTNDSTAEKPATPPAAATPIQSEISITPETINNGLQMLTAVLQSGLFK